MTIFSFNNLVEYISFWLYESNSEIFGRSQRCLSSFSDDRVRYWMGWGGQYWATCGTPQVKSRKHDPSNTTRFLAEVCSPAKCCLANSTKCFTLIAECLHMISRRDECAHSSLLDIFEGTPLPKTDGLFWLGKMGGGSSPKQIDFLTYWVSISLRSGDKAEKENGGSWGGFVLQ